MMYYIKMHNEIDDITVSRSFNGSNKFIEQLGDKRIRLKILPDIGGVYKKLLLLMVGVSELRKIFKELYGNDAPVCQYSEKGMRIFNEMKPWIKKERFVLSVHKLEKIRRVSYICDVGNYNL